MSTISAYTGDGSTTQFDVTFFYRDSATVKASLDGVETEAFTFINPSRIEFAEAPATGVEIKIFRKTDVSSAAVTFEDGAIVLGSDLNEAVAQPRERVEEIEADVNAITEAALKAPVGEALPTLPSAEERVDGYLAFGAGGAPIIVQPPGSDLPLRSDLASTDPGKGAAMVAIGGGRTLAMYFASLQLSTIKTSETAANNATTLNAEIAAISAAGGGTLSILPGDYPFVGALTLKDNVTLLAKGVTLDGVGVYLYTALGTGAENWTVESLRISTDTTVNHGAFRLFDVTKFNLLGLTYERSGVDDGFTGQLIGASHGTIDTLTATGSSDLWVEGHDLTLHGGRMISSNGGGDDCIAIKAPDTLGSGNDERANSSYKITISDWQAEGYASIVSFGSEIGKFQANDATYSRAIRDVTCTGLVGKNCSRIAFIKPGGNSGNDFRDGTVEDIVISGAVLEDYEGNNFQSVIDITAGRGARVREIHLTDLVARVRAQSGIPTNTGFNITAYDYVGGTAATIIDGVYANRCSIVDARGGAPNGASEPGYPIDYGVLIERNIGSGGTAPIIGTIEFNGFKLNGTRRNAVYTGTGLTGPISFDGPTFKNICHTTDATADRGAFALNSKVSVRNASVSLSASAPAGSRPILADDATVPSVDIVGDQERIHIGELAAGATAFRSFVAPRNCWIRKIEIVSRAAVAADATNKITVQADNAETVGTITVADTNTGFVLSANTPVSIHGANQLRGANTLLSKDEVLAFEVTSGGTATLTGAALIVHYVPYGAP